MMCLSGSHVRLAVGVGLLAAVLLRPMPSAIADTVVETPVFLPVEVMLGDDGEDLAQKRLQRIMYRQRWQRANTLFRIGDYQGAAANFMALVDEPLGDDGLLYEIRYHLAESLFHVGAYPGARTYFETVHLNAPHGPYADQTNMRLVEIAIWDGDLEEATRRLALIEPTSPYVSRASYLLGRRLAASNPSLSAEYLAMVRPASELYPRAQYHLGALVVGMPQGFARAVTHFETARQTLPDEAPAGPDADPQGPMRLAQLRELISLSLARIHADEGRFQQALEEYQRIPDDGEHLDAALLESAWVLLQVDQVLPALQNVRILLRDRPESPKVLEAALLVGYLSIEQEQFDQAFGHFEDTRVLLEQLQARLQLFSGDVTEPESFYNQLVATDDGRADLPRQIAMWVERGSDVEASSELIRQVAGVQEEMRDLNRLLEHIEVLAAGPRGGPNDPAGLEDRIRRELSELLYDLQARILAVRLRPFLREISTQESSVLRTIRRVRADLETIRQLPTDINLASGGRQEILGSLTDYLLQIHPEIGLDVQRTDENQVAEVEDPLRGDTYLREARRNLAELSRHVSLDDMWIDAALEYTVYLEDRLHQAIFRRLRVDERYDFVQAATSLFRQSAELQRSLRNLGVTLADIQEDILLDMRVRADAERWLLDQYHEVARYLDESGRHRRGIHAREEYQRILASVSDTAVQADLGALDTGWRIKELEEIKVRELLSEKHDRQALLEAYYAQVLETKGSDEAIPGVEDFSPEALAQQTGSIDSPYGRELLTLGQEVVGLAKALYDSRLQLEVLQEGATGAVLTPEERATLRSGDGQGRQIRLETPPVPEGRGIPLAPGGNP